MSTRRRKKAAKKKLVPKKRAGNARRVRGAVPAKLPPHLAAFVATQDPSLYTPIDHASWRFIMRVSQRFFAEKAHEKYLDGLEETGISIERIPLISEMDAKLRRFGWRAVPVVGFIPPAVFLEYLSIGVLPIACDMRTLEHLGYTPAPDIVHEAAGHAPIIADRAYAAYLRKYGEVSRKAIIAQHDVDLYDAIRLLSDVKEDPKSTTADIALAEKRLNEALGRIDHTSEASELSRMAWWTTEYGLVGEMTDPKIYGAGLLSSISESYHCFSNSVRKIPFDLNCIRTEYDITKPQPQLFVTPDFKHLEKVLEEFARTMSYRVGGSEGLKKALRAKAVCTVELDTGLQIGGTLVETINGKDGKPAYLRFSGECQLAAGAKELKGHGTSYHKNGFSTPVGRIESERRLATGRTEMKFESGVRVEGRLKSRTKYRGREIILSFEDCTVRFGDRVLFEPSWGTFDLVLGEKVVSVFGNAPDRAAYLQSIGGYKQRPARPKTNLTAENAELCRLYAQVRALREKTLKMKPTIPNLPSAETLRLSAVVERLEKKYPNDWLLRLEILELIQSFDSKAKLRHEVDKWIHLVAARLDRIGQSSAEKLEMIERGRELFGDARKRGAA